MKEDLVSVVIATTGKDRYIEDCLLSLMAQKEPVNQIIVIYNNAPDYSAARIESICPSAIAKVIRESIPYSRALNIGISQSRGEFVLCLNDDVKLGPGYITQALKGFMVDKRIGMVSGKILRPDKLTIDSTGLFISIFRTAKERGYGLRDNGRYQRPGYVFGVNGAVAFYRRQMLEEIKEGTDYFYNGFSFFYEDLDLAWRANNSGWRGYYMPEAAAYHTRGGTLRSDMGIGKSFARFYLSDEMEYALVKNRNLTITRNESLAGRILYFPFTLIYSLAVLVYLLILRPKVFLMIIKRR